MPAPGPSSGAELEQPPPHPPSTGARALTAAGALAKQLTDPSILVSTPASGRPWPQALATGAAGIALLHIERAHTGHADWEIAHHWVSAACAEPLTAAANACLYMGAPAVAFTLHAASSPGSALASRGYRHALHRLDEATVTLTQTRLDTAHARINRGEPPVLKEFDLIRGLTGLGAYHLRRHPDHPITAQVLRYLVRLTQPGDITGSRPPWWTPVAPTGNPDPAFPHGHGNIGASHGISAPLALLSLATLSDVTAPGTREAIERLCGWTDQWIQHDDTGPWWPGLITTDQVHANTVDQQLRPRPSWCYGVAGTARAQQLAALALNDPARQHTAETAMLTTLRNPAQVERLTDPGLCHGLAGLLHTTWRMARDAQGPDLAAQIPHLTDHLLTRLETPARACTADPSLLDGAAGIALTLHTIGTATSPHTGWDAILATA